MRAPDEASGAARAEQDGQAPGAAVGLWGTVAAVVCEPWSMPGCRRDIDARLDAVRARIKTLRERDLDVGTMWIAGPRDRLTAAERHAAEARAAATRVLVTSEEAFRRAAEAHEQAARLHERTAASGVGYVRGHEQQAALHRAAAAADRQRAQRAQLLLSHHERVGPGMISDEPDDGVAF